MDEEGLGDVEDDMIGAAEDDAFFEEVAQTDAAEISLDHSAHNILQVNGCARRCIGHFPLISMIPCFRFQSFFSLCSILMRRYLTFTLTFSLGFS